MNFLLDLLKKLFAPTFNKAKSQVLKELDKAIADLRNPQSVVVNDLVKALLAKLQQILGSAHLPAGATVLLQIVLTSVDWVALAEKPAGQVASELERIRRRVEGARL